MYIESIFLKECCEIILKKANQGDTKKYLLSMYIHYSPRSISYINFLIALEYSTQNLFENSLDKLFEIRDLDSYFLRVDITTY